MYRAPFCHIFVDRLPKSGTLKAQKNAFRGGQCYGRKNDPAYLYEERSSCGCSNLFVRRADRLRRQRSLAQNEVRVGAFIVEVYDGEGECRWHSSRQWKQWQHHCDGETALYSSSGKGFVEYPYEGMFTAKVKENQLKTLKPTSGKLQSSDMLFGKPYKKENVTQLELQFDNNESSGAFPEWSAPVELTINVNNAKGMLYLTRVENRIVVTNTKPVG
ncbi:MAG: hypothetical protein V8R88_00975 [Faecalibacterium prausnitzii]